MDSSPPVVINCPLDIIKYAELGTIEVPVFWLVPSAIDLSDSTLAVDATYKPGDYFAVGSTTMISYVFVDSYLNEATCNFLVSVTEGMLTTCSVRIIIC